MVTNSLWATDRFRAAESRRFSQSILDCPQNRYQIEPLHAAFSVISVSLMMLNKLSVGLSRTLSYESYTSKLLLLTACW